VTTDAKTRFWGGDGDEVLIYTDPHEYIENLLDSYHPESLYSTGTITAYEYKPMTVTASDCGAPLEYILEMLDEEYGSPDKGFTATDAMIQAEKAFINAVLAEYRPWACEQTGKSVTAKAVDWVREHRPDWLESK